MMVDDMTREWWDMLPQAYRDADRMGATGDPTLTGPEWPLYRYMEGPGSILTAVQAQADRAEAGTLTSPSDNSSFSELRWLATLLGVKVGNLPWADLLVALRVRIQNGPPLVGTRQHISLAAQYALGEDTPVAVYTDPDVPWTIYVMTDEVHLVAAGGRAAVQAKLAAYGATPAGFTVIPVAAQATWEQFDGAVNAAGGTWDDYMALVRTWADHDSVGVVIPED